MNQRTIYAIYKGDEFIDLGTSAELAKKRGTSKETIEFKSTPTYEKRCKSYDKVERTYIIKDGENEMKELIQIDNKIWRDDGNYYCTDCFAYQSAGVANFKCKALRTEHCTGCNFYTTRKEYLKRMASAPPIETFKDEYGEIRVRSKKKIKEMR